MLNSAYGKLHRKGCKKVLQRVKNDFFCINISRHPSILENHGVCRWMSAREYCIESNAGMTVSTAVTVGEG